MAGGKFLPQGWGWERPDAPYPYRASTRPFHSSLKNQSISIAGDNRDELMRLAEVINHGLDAFHAFGDDLDELYKAIHDNR